MSCCCLIAICFTFFALCYVLINCFMFFNYSFFTLISCIVRFAFYLCVLCFCVVLCIVSPHVYSSLFPICAQLYPQLPPGGNPIAVNIISYHIISYHIISYHTISYQKFRTELSLTFQIKKKKVYCKLETGKSVGCCTYCRC